MDFYQNQVTTVHDLRVDPSRMARRVEELTQARPACVLIPMVYAEMGRPALERIRTGLARCGFLNEVVVSLTAENEKQHREVTRFFAELPVPVTVAWCESPTIREKFAELRQKGIYLEGLSGKGLAVWLGFGLASEGNYAILCHDADIETYDPSLPASLLLPIVDPDLDFFFSKGYYARLSDSRMYGRVVRLFVWPFLDSLANVLGARSPYLRYLRAFRYPLSGEFALTSDLARNLRVPTDWGLELGVLAEVYRNTAQKRICQVDLGVYSHKHKDVGRNADEGLQRMVRDLAVTVLRSLTENEATTLSEASLLALRVVYRRTAQDYVRRYFVDAEYNGLAYDRHDEESTIEAFVHALERAEADYLQAPSAALIPDWLRILSAEERLPATLKEASLWSDAGSLEIGRRP